MEKESIEKKGETDKLFNIAGFEGFEALVIIVIGGVAFALCEMGIIPLDGALKILFMTGVGAVAGLVAHFSGRLLSFLSGIKYKEDEEIVEDIITRRKDKQ